MDKKDRKIYVYAFLISLLIHLLGLFLFGFYEVFSLTVPVDQLKKEDTKPIVLEFERPKQKQEQKTEKEPAEQFPDQNRFYEVVDNPNADEQRPEKGNLLASKSSLSAAPDVTNPDKALAPKDEDNITKKKDLPQKEQTSSQKQPEEVMDLEGNVPVFALKNQRQFSKNALTEDNPSQQQESEQQKQTSNDPLTQKEFDAELIGNVRFSTYAWDWAPWWLAFENKIMQYWFAPTAWQMGLIEGYTYVKIRVNREGELMDYEILKHQGHPSLRESSTNALESVFPFKALPPDFPEDHLEIKFVMVYPNLKELYRKNR